MVGQDPQVEATHQFQMVLTGLLSSQTRCYHSGFTYLAMSFHNRQKASCNAFLRRSWPALQWMGAKVTLHSFADEPVNSPVHKLTSDSPSLKSSPNLIRVTNKIINKIAIDHHFLGRLVSLLANHQRLKIHDESASQNQYVTSFMKTTVSLLTSVSTRSCWWVCGCDTDPVLTVKLHEV